MNTGLMETELLRFVVRLMNVTISMQSAHNVSIDKTCGRVAPICTATECLNAVERECSQNEQVLCRQLVRLVAVMTQSLKNEQKEMILCLTLFCKLIIIALRSGLPQRFIQRGFTRMMLRTQLYVADENSLAQLNFQWRNPDDVLALVHSRIMSHTVAHWHGHPRENLQDSALLCIADLVVVTFVATMQADQVSSTAGLSPDLVLHHTIVGPAVDKSVTLKSTLLMDIPVTRDTITLLGGIQRRDLVVALYECSLEHSEGDDSRTIEFDTEHGRDDSASSAEHALLDSFAMALQRSHVQMVACQKRVHPYLVRRLKSLNIVCISRVSVKYIGALARLSGARLLTTIPLYDSTHSSVVDASSLGYLRSVQYEHLHGKPFMVIRGHDVDTSDDCAGGEIDRWLSHLPIEFRQILSVGVAQRQRGCVTVLITAPTDITAALWQAAVEDCIGYLRRQADSTAVVLPGKGIWLAGLARELERQQASASASAGSEGYHSRVALQTVAAERLFVECIKECAVADGGAATLRRQLSPDGEGWDHAQVFDRFVLPGVDHGNVPEGKKGALVMQSPDGHRVAVVCGPRDSTPSPQNCSSQFQPKFWLDAKTEKFPPLDSLSGSLQALRVATDMACALLDVDGFHFVPPKV